jgi:hypothetical protein
VSERTGRARNPGAVLLISVPGMPKASTLLFTTSGMDGILNGL